MQKCAYCEVKYLEQVPVQAQTQRLVTPDCDSECALIGLSDLDWGGVVQTWVETKQGQVEFVFICCQLCCLETPCV